MRPPVLLLHGFLGRGADWDAVRAGLPPGRSVLAPDLPGHGANLDSTATMDAAAAALAEEIGEVGDGEPADVVGYSMGGRLALHLAVRHPEVVRRLALVSASPGLRTETERADRRGLDEQRAQDIEADLPAFLDRWYRLPLFGLPNALRQRLTADRLAHAVAAGLAASLRGMGTGRQPSHWDALAGISVPTLAVAGDRDAKFVALAREMAAAPGVRAETVPGAAHLLPLERPAALASLLIAFLD